MQQIKKKLFTRENPLFMYQINKKWINTEEGQNIYI